MAVTGSLGWRTGKGASLPIASYFQFFPVTTTRTQSLSNNQGRSLEKGIKKPCLAFRSRIRVGRKFHNIDLINPFKELKAK